MANHRRIDSPNDGVSFERSAGFPVIKRIELINFMSHRHTVIEPAAGLTVLVGPNNCGKSAIVTALQILCHNDNSTYVLRHGAKECRIIVETSEGHRIEWIRKKSGSPSYILNGKEFDRLRNDSGVWDELKKTLRMPRLEFDNNNKFDVHIGEQRNPIFLLGDKGRGAAQFFASSSDASRLVEMQALHKKQVAENKSEQKFLVKQQTEINQSLECLEEVAPLDKNLAECESQYESLKAQQQSIEQLSRDLATLKQNKQDIGRFALVATTLCSLSTPPKFENSDALLQLTEQLRSEQQSIDLGNAQLAALETLASPPSVENEDALAQLVGNLRVQKRLVERFSRSHETLAAVARPPQAADTESVSTLAKFILLYRTELETQADLKKQLAQADKNLQAVTAEIEEWAGENPNCPTCGNQISADAMISGGHRHG